MSRTSKRRREQRRRRQSRGALKRRQGSVPDTMPSVGPAPDAIFEVVYRESRGLADTPDPIDSEMVASGLVATWMDAATEIRNSDELGSGLDPMAVLGRAMIDYLQRKATPDALALLYGLAAVDSMAMQLDYRRAIRDMIAAGVAAPTWADLVGRARLEHAWVATDVFGDQDSLVGRFSYQGEAPHDLSLLIDHNIFHIAKDASINRASADLRGSWERLEQIQVEDIGVQDYADRVADALDNLETVWHPRIDEGLPYLLPLILRRLTTLPPPQPILRGEMSRTARDKLYTRFRRSDSGRALGRDTHLVRDLIDYATGQFGDALHWSPTVVELCLTDWFPAKFVLDDADIERLPVVLRAWVRFTGLERDLSDVYIAELVTAVDEFEAEFREAMGDLTQSGVAKTIGTLMLSDGVDLTDADEVQRWIDDFNARPDSERFGLTGGLDRR